MSSWKDKDQNSLGCGKKGSLGYLTVSTTPCGVNSASEEQIYLDGSNRLRDWTSRFVFYKE